MLAVSSQRSAQNLKPACSPVAPTPHLRRVRERRVRRFERLLEFLLFPFPLCACHFLLGLAGVRFLLAGFAGFSSATTGRSGVNRDTVSRPMKKPPR
jgi:hypothetical protein